MTTHTHTRGHYTQFEERYKKKATNASDQPTNLSSHRSSCYCRATVDRAASHHYIFLGCTAVLCSTPRTEWWTSIGKGAPSCLHKALELQQVLCGRYQDSEGLLIFTPRMGWQTSSVRSAPTCGLSTRATMWPVPSRRNSALNMSRTDGLRRQYGTETSWLHHAPKLWRAWCQHGGILLSTLLQVCMIGRKERWSLPARCNSRGCIKGPSFGVTGTNSARFCSSGHKDGMADVKNKEWAHFGCTTRPIYVVTSSETERFYRSNQGRDGGRQEQNAHPL